MLVDWFTVVAQVINFLILVWLLKRYLYKPILLAIESREQRIAAQLADADSKKADAQKARDEYHRKSQAFDLERDTLLKQATDAAKLAADRILNEARTSAAELRLKSREDLQFDSMNLHQAIRLRASQEVFSIASKTLKELANMNLEQAIIDVFIHKLTELNGEPKQRLLTAADTTSNPAIVRTTVELPSDLRVSLERAIRQTLGTAFTIQFQTAPELISGIELETNGQKLAWNIEDYLDSLQQGVEELLRINSTPVRNGLTPSTTLTDAPVDQTRSL